LTLLGKYSTTSNTRPAFTSLFFRPLPTSTQCVPIFLVGRQLIEKLSYVTLHPVRLSIGTLQNLPSCFHTSRFKGITSIHRQRPLQKKVNNHTDNVNGVTFVTRKLISPEGPIFFIVTAVVRQSLVSVLISSMHTKTGTLRPLRKWRPLFQNRFAYSPAGLSPRILQWPLPKLNISMVQRQSSILQSA